MNVVEVAYTMPVAIISIAPDRSSRRRCSRHPHVPVNIVSTAEPSSIPVTITPMRVALYPNWSPRYPASEAATSPSA